MAVEDTEAKRDTAATKVRLPDAGWLDFMQLAREEVAVARDATRRARRALLEAAVKAPEPAADELDVPDELEDAAMTVGERIVEPLRDQVKEFDEQLQRYANGYPKMEEGGEEDAPDEEEEDGDADDGSGSAGG